MKELIIDENESNQRLDRYIRKYLNKASLGFIYKQIRKKNIVVNDKKASEKYMLEKGDVVKIYFSDETIDKFRKIDRPKNSNVNLKIIYEDENIIIMNKPSGLLSHSANSNYREENLVDAMVSYLIDKGDYVPRRNPTFTPSIANRLDKNTSGIVIGAKNFNTIQELNEAQRKGNIKKYYYTVVKGNVNGEKVEYANIEKVENKENLVSVSKENTDDKKTIITGYKSIYSGKNYSLLEINLITGRTHQIRAHLSYLNMPIIGDRKYGNKRVNNYFKKEYGLKNQLLHCHKVIIEGLEGDLKYLNGREFKIENPKILDRIIEGEIYG